MIRPFAIWLKQYEAMLHGKRSEVTLTMVEDAYGAGVAAGLAHASSKPFAEDVAALSKYIAAREPR